MCSFLVDDSGGADPETDPARLLTLTGQIMTELKDKPESVFQIPLCVSSPVPCNRFEMLFCCFFVFISCLYSLLVWCSSSHASGGRAWSVEFVGEGSTDAGGPYNESITQMCEELMSSALPLFIRYGHLSFLTVFAYFGIW